MTIERDKITGAWLVSQIICGRLVSRQYYGYTRREAISLFIEEAHQ